MLGTLSTTPTECTVLRSLGTTIAALVNQIQIPRDARLGAIQQDALNQVHLTTLAVISFHITVIQRHARSSVTHPNSVTGSATDT